MSDIDLINEYKDQVSNPKQEVAELQDVSLKILTKVFAKLEHSQQDLADATKKINELENELKKLKDDNEIYFNYDYMFINISNLHEPHKWVNIIMIVVLDGYAKSIELLDELGSEKVEQQRTYTSFFAEKSKKRL